ncbi:hypothetical protein ACP6PK_13205, partial [Dapis sp. BLCC M172]
MGNLEAINDDFLNKNILYYLGNFKPKQAKLLIQELTDNSQFKIEKKLTEKLVEDLAEELGEIRPIELQVVGAELQAENITTLAKYQDLGDNPKAKLVDKYLESVVRDCGVENEKLAWLVLWLLTDENNTRPLKTEAELAKESKLNVENLELVLEIFVKSRLVFLLPENPADRYQLVHDYLVGLIRQRTGNEILQKLEQAEEKQRQAEEKQRQLQKRLVRLSVAASLMMAVLAGGMTIFALQKQRESRRAERQTIISQVNEARALSISGDRWEGLIKAMEARQKQIYGKFNPRGETRKLINILRTAIYKPNEKFREHNRLEGHEDWVIGVAFSPDGETI